MPKSEIAVDDYLLSFPKKIRLICSKLRKLVKEIIPHNIEAVYPGWNLIGYRVLTEKTSRYFCFIAPFEDKVKLGFEYGNMMSENKLLKTMGTQVKYIEIESINDISSEALGSLISEAAMLAIEKNQHK